MTVTALAIIEDAYQRCNRLSPGEPLNADDAAFGFARLNLLVDKLSATNQFLFKNVITSATQSGHITLGVGSWAAIDPGDNIVSMVTTSIAGGTSFVPMSPLTMQQYNTLPTPTDSGAPCYYAQDGLSTVYLYPVATGQTLKIQTLAGVASFADQTTAYTVPPGYKNALGAILATKVAPTVLGGVPAWLKTEADSAEDVINNYKPAIIDVGTFTRRAPRRASILNGW